MNISDFEDFFKMKEQQNEFIHPKHVRLLKGKIKWFICLSNGAACVYDSEGRCYLSEDECFDTDAVPIREDENHVILGNITCMRNETLDLPLKQQ